MHKKVFRKVVVIKKGWFEKTILGDPLGARTQDPHIKSVMLYLLS